MNRGSYSRRSKTNMPSNGFNEAPIHESGKSDAGCPHGHPAKASMRPRFMNRGSGEITPEQAARMLELQ